MLDLTWRFVVADASSGRLITLLDRRSTARKVTRTLNKAAQATGTAPSDYPEINLVLGDGFPFVEEGVRNVYGFRKEQALPNPPWVCRFAGRILMLEDNVEESSGAPYTNWTAYDPRQLLYMRPVLTADGELPGPNGVKFEDTPADEIVVALIQRTIDANGDVGIDMTGGTITPCPETNFHFEQGVSVGDALDQLADANYADVFMDPVYDPLVRPGVMAELSVYPLRARIRHHAVFAWDLPSRSLVSVNRLIDGTQRANRIQFYAGQGGPAAVEASDPTSVATFGEYWAQQFFPGQNLKDGAEALADEQLLIRKNGAITFKVNPAPARSTISTPVTLSDYDVGDCVPIYASSRFREAVNTVKRVYEIPIEIRDDGTETVSQLSFAEGVCSEDDATDVDPGEPPSGGGGGGPPPSGDAYLYEPFDGSSDAYWNESIEAVAGGSPAGSIDYVGGCVSDAIELSIPAEPSGVGARLVSKWIDAGGSYSGYSGIGIAGAVEETWYRALVRFPTGYRATRGNWNWWMIWHDDAATHAECNSFGNNGASCAMGVIADGSVTTPDQAGTNPRLWARMLGGHTNAPVTYSKILPVNSLQINHCYEMVMHYIWDEPGGLFEWWMDGVQVVSKVTPTLYRRANNSLSYNTFGLYNYHPTADFANAIDFDEVYLGPDAASIGFTP